MPLDQFNRILLPESALDTNQVILRLSECTEKKLEALIRILRETAGEAGVAHEELADALEKTFKEYKENGCPGMYIFETKKYSVLMKRYPDYREMSRDVLISGG